MTLSELFLEYDAKRNRAQQAAAQRRSALFANKPALAALLEEKENVSLAYLKAILEQPGKKAEYEAQTKQVLLRINEQIAALAGPDFERETAPRYDCPLCQDTGYHTQGNRKQLCRCMLERVYTDIYGAKPVLQMEGSFAAFLEGIEPPAAQRKTLAAVRRFLEETAERYPAGPHILVFMGESGLGKTFAMGALAKALYEKTQKILAIDAFSLFSVFHRSRLGENIPLEPIYDCEALFLDDLGTEPMTANVTREYLFRMVERRMHKLTVISTNLSETQLKERYTEKVTSRLFMRNVGKLLRFEGQDLRWKIV